MNGSSPTPDGSSPCVSSSTSVSSYWSKNGYIWNFINTANPGFTIGAVGLFVNCQKASLGVAAFFDFIRFNWTP